MSEIYGTRETETWSGVGKPMKGVVSSATAPRRYSMWSIRPSETVLHFPRVPTESQPCQAPVSSASRAEVSQKCQMGDQR